MSDPDRQARRSRRRRIALRAALIGSLLIAALVLGLVGVHVVGRYRLSAALERIRAAGEPVLPEDIVFEPVGPGEDPTAWLAAAGEIELPWTGDVLDEPILFAEVLDEARSGELAADHAALLREFELCYGSPEYADLFWTDLRKALRDPGPGAALSDCELTAL